MDHLADRVEGRLLQRSTHPLLLAFAILSSYTFFGLLAATRFPHGYGPWRDNTLSQLGNSNLNPNGYALYLVGCALGGVFTITFFASFSSRRLGGSVVQGPILLLLRGLGVFGGFALFMNAVFPEVEYAPHHFWAGVVFNAFAGAALVSIPALWRAGGSNFWLIGFNSVAFGAVILMFVFSSVHWVEWLPVGLFLLFPVLLSARLRALASDTSGEAGARFHLAADEVEPVTDGEWTVDGRRAPYTDHAEAGQRR